MAGTGKLQGKRSLEIASEFARHGSDVVLHYSHAPDGAISAAAEIQAIGRRATVFKADFNDQGAAITLADAALEFLGSTDSRVNNAGISFYCPFLRVEPRHLDTLFNVNFRTLSAYPENGGRNVETGQRSDLQRGLYSRLARCS